MEQALEVHDHDDIWQVEWNEMTSDGKIIRSFFYDFSNSVFLNTKHYLDWPTSPKLGIISSSLDEVF